MRHFLWKAHRWLGLGCLLPMAMLSLTGIGLLLLPGWTDRGMASAAKDLDVAMALARQHFPGATTGMILPPASSGAEWTISLRAPQGPPLSLPLPLSAGGHPGTRSPAGWTRHDVLLGLHNSLLLGLPGKVVMLATGLGVLLFKTLGEGGRGAARGDPTSSPAAAPLAPMVARALEGHPGARIMAIQPGAVGRPVSIILLARDVPPWGKVSTLMFDARTGRALPPRPVPGFMRAMIAAKSLHTVLWSAAPVRIFYLLCAACPLALTLSGLRLWLIRRRPSGTLPR